MRGHQFRPSTFNTNRSKCSAFSAELCKLDDLLKMTGTEGEYE